MNKGLLVGLLLLIGVGGYIFFSPKTVDKTVMESDSNEVMIADDKKTDDSMDSGEVMMDGDHQVGEYVDYSEKRFMADFGKRRVYYFYATWCPTCKQADKDIRSRLDEIPGDVVIYKTNYDKEIALKKKYDVTYQHTFVQVDENGKEVMKWNGGDMDELLRKII